MAKLDPIRKLNYLGGINRQPLQGEGQAYLITNARPLRTGGLQVRYGQTLDKSVGADPTDGSITDLFAYRTAALGTRLYSLRRTSAGDKFYDNTTEITGPTLSGATYTSIVEGKGTIFISNGNSGDIEYHTPGQTTRAVITNSFSGETLPQCQFLQVYRNRLYAWTDTGLRYTNTGIYSTLPAVHFANANKIQVREENVTAAGLGVGKSIIVLFSPDSFSIMFGTPGNNGGRNDFTLKEHHGIGCGAPRSITSKGNQIAWLDTERRMHMLEGPTLSDLDEPDFIAEFLHAADNMQSVSAQFLGRELWVSLPKGGSVVDRHILVYDLFLEKWVARFVGIEGYAISYLPEVNSVFVGSHTGGYIWRQASGNFRPLNDAGTLIPYELIDGQLVFGDLWHQKIYEKILVATKMAFSETINFSYSTDEIDDFTNFELNNSITSATHNWGTDNYGEYAWDSTGLQITTLRPKKPTGLEAASLRLKMSGNLSGGTVIYGSESHARSVDRDGESGIT
jgi:hypothetical protein